MKFISGQQAPLTKEQTMVILQFGFVILLILMMWMLILFLESLNRQAVNRNLTSRAHLMPPPLAPALVGSREAASAAG
jgi:hypothetical protein